MHLDRILFGTNTIFVFKYPLIRRKLQVLESDVREDRMTDADVAAKAREVLKMQNLFEVGDGDEEEERKS